MALRMTEKIKILGVLKNKEDFYYENFDFKPRKYTDDELIEYLLDLIIKNLGGDKEVKSNTLNRHFNALYTIFEYCLVTDRKFSDKLAKRTISLKEDYVSYLKKLKIDSNKEVEERLFRLVNLVINNRANIDESFLRDGTEAIYEDEEEVEQVAVSLTKEQDELNKLKIELGACQKDSSKKDTIIKELKRKKETLEKTILNYKREVNTNIKDKENLQKEMESLEKDLKRYQKLVDELTKKIATQENREEELQSKLEKIQKEKQKLDKDRKRIELYSKKEQRLLELQTVKQEIILLISERQLTINEIKEELNNKGFIITNEELQYLLNTIRNTMNIYSGSKTIPETFHIERINPQNVNIVNNTYRLLTNGEQEIRILLVADVHSDMKSLRSFEVYKSLYDYCFKNKISNIFLLGDLLDCFCNYDISKKEELYDTIKYYQENIAMFLDKYPQCDEITNAFLGGNHEKMMFDVGINPVEIITNSRLDFVSLGYNDAIIRVKNNWFGVHHPNRVVNSEKEEAVKSYLKKYYKNSNLEKSYIDIFGHFHTNCLNPINGYLLLPSLTRNGDDVKGAYEMRIILNEKGFIGKIVFVPLIFNRKILVNTYEIEYKKMTLEKTIN